MQYYLRVNNTLHMKVLPVNYVLYNASNRGLIIDPCPARSDR